MTKKTKLIILIPLVAVVLNGLGYIIAINMRASAKGSGSGGVAETPRAAPAERVGDDRTRDERVKEEKAMARRAAGMAALESGDYERALADFAEARALAGEKAYVSELLRVTEDLAHRQPGPRRPVVVRTPPPPPARPVGRFRLVERTAPRERAPAPSQSPLPAQPAPPPPASSGLLLVATTPRGLLVQVDEVPVDLTPTRAALKIGPHHVAFFDGDRKVYETNVDVRGGAPTTLLKDLSAELAPPARLSPSPTPFAKEESSRSLPATRAVAVAPIAPVTESDEARAPPPRPPARKLTPLPASTGGLEVTSPGLYGEIWINGRPWGFPPVRASDLPPGPTRVAVRVNGVEERSAVVAVQAGLTTSVMLNRREGNP